jgi:hypothetical protein
MRAQKFNERAMAKLFPLGIKYLPVVGAGVRFHAPEAPS